MIKLLPIALIGFVIIGMTSCKKEYTCSCVPSLEYSITPNDVSVAILVDWKNYGDSHDITAETSKQKGSESEEWCSSKSEVHVYEETQYLPVYEFAVDGTLYVDSGYVTQTSTIKTNCNLLY